MCAIIGIASQNKILEKNWLVGGRDKMLHRGPDDAGEWWSADGCVGLGHRRLAILDLTPAAHQPMEDASGELCIVFNGEIYNFEELRYLLVKRGYFFRSNSDTEVLLFAYREWGTDCLNRLNGMFAFALYDSRQRQLFLARDRAGEKPLFYAKINNSLRFASELKGLLVDKTFPRRIDPVALDCYLAFGYVPGDRCILQGINKLPPAHALTYSLESGQIHIWRYWQLPDFDNNRDKHSDEISLLNELIHLLEDAVQKQLVADVSVGILLSGGVDSSLVTAVAANRTKKIRTFTITFPGYKKIDEAQYARLIANHFGTEHIEMDASAITVELLPLLAKQFDEPIVDSSMIPTYLVSRLVREHCTVALGGDGGDELFGGYKKYNRLLWLRQKAKGLPLKLRRIIARNAENFLQIGTKGRNFLQEFGSDLEAGLPLHGLLFDSKNRKLLLQNWQAIDNYAEQLFQSRIPYDYDLIQRATKMDFQNYLPEQILVKVDRTSMLNSLELRAPFLDFRIIEFAFGKVPSHMKVTLNNRKILLKKLAERILPLQFDKHRKQGFSIPLSSWLLSGSWQSFFKEILLGDNRDSIFDKKIVKELFRGQEKGRANSERLFALVFFELWRKEYGITL